MISILMATYNGARFIAEQINSLLLQTEQNFVLHIQDDCSSDETFSVLCDYAAKYPQKIIVHRRTENCGGAKWNFLYLMADYQDDYVMLCDQDDVWLPNKIANTLKVMQAAENENGAETPLLVHTDLTVVNESLVIISESLNKMLGLRMEYCVLSSQSIQNTITGCTAMYNRALAQLIRVPQFCIVHDWWLGLIATSFGEIVYLPERTLLYRQHGANSIGAKNIMSFAYIINEAFHPRKIRAQLKATYQQAEEFLRIYGDITSPSQKAFLSEYASIPNYGKIQRWMILNRLRSLKSGFVRKLAQLIYI